MTIKEKVKTYADSVVIKKSVKDSLKDAYKAFGGLLSNLAKATLSGLKVAAALTGVAIAKIGILDQELSNSLYNASTTVLKAEGKKVLENDAEAVLHTAEVAGNVLDAAATGAYQAAEVIAPALYNRATTVVKALGSAAVEGAKLAGQAGSQAVEGFKGLLTGYEAAQAATVPVVADIELGLPAYHVDANMHGLMVGADDGLEARMFGAAAPAA